MSIANEIPNATSTYANASNSNTKSASKLLDSRLDIINGTSEVQTIISDSGKKIKNATSNRNSIGDQNNLVYDYSTDLDDPVLAAFANDFSYEIVQK
jgi:hypothetical protein